MSPERSRAGRVAFRRLRRAPWARRPAVICGVVSGLLLVSVILTTSQSLSAQQVADRDLGRFQVQLTVNGATHAQAGTLDDVEQSIPARRASLVLTSTAVSPPSLPTDRFVYREAAWTRAPFPDLTLTAGRWPRTGEVVVDPSTADQFRLGSRIRLAADVSLTVVGVARDAYSSSATLYLPPGTWASLPGTVVNGLRLDAMSVIFLTTSAARAQVTTALEAASLSAQATTREQSEAETSWIVESPFAVLVPLATLPLLASIVTAGLARRRARRFVARASAVGMTPRVAGNAARLASLTWALTGALAGVGLGTAAGAALRPWAGRLADQPPGPIPHLVPVVGIIVLSVTVGSFLGLGRLTPRRRAARDATTSRPSAWRLWAAFVALCAAAFAFYRVNDVASAMVLGAILLLAWLLITPDVVIGAARLLPTARPAPRLAGRLVVGHHAAAAAATATLTVLVVLPVTTVLVLSATGTASRNSALADVAQGQVGVDVSNLDGKQLRTAVALTKTAARSEDGHVVAVSTRDAWYDVASGNALVLSVQTPDDAQTVLDRPLDRAQVRALQAGGMLVWQPGYTLLGNEHRVDQPPPQIRYDPAPEWRKQAGAVLLDSTAHQLGLGASPDRLVITGMGPEGATQLRTTLTEHGVDSGRVSEYHAPRAIAPPVAISLSAATLGVLALLTAAAAARAHASTLRRNMGRLVAIGAPRAFAAHVLAWCQLASAATATTAGLLISAGTVLALTGRQPEIQLNPPWIILGLYIASLGVITWASGPLLARFVRPAASRHD